MNNRITLAGLLLMFTTSFAYGLSVIAQIPGNPDLTIYEKPIEPGINRVAVDRCAFLINDSGTLVVTWQPGDPQNETIIIFDPTLDTKYSPSIVKLHPNEQQKVVYTQTSRGCDGSIYFTISNIVKKADL